MINTKKWVLPNIDINDKFIAGDMPGDKIKISQNHINNSLKIAEHLEKIIADLAQKQDKIVISVYGGSGVGKSETAALLGYILNQNGIGTYILSGDNYPRRIPMSNDMERLRVFREHAIKGLVETGKYKSHIQQNLDYLKNNDLDCDQSLTDRYDFLNDYISSGVKGLKDYLGTTNEIDFNEVNEKIIKFKSGEKRIMLKRMGRKEEELWYDEVTFCDVDVLIIEWTHGNNENLCGIDIPILLNSTPEETLEHRKKRNRDKGVDSPFVSMVLKIEQEKIFKQTKNAKVIITKQGEIITYEEYLELMR